jgi:hypothetical protein
MRITHFLTNINTLAMNFFSKNRYVFWLLIFLVVINLSALVTFLIFFSQNPYRSVQHQPENPGLAFRNELSLTPSQSEKVTIILTEYRNSAEPLKANIKNYRAQLLDELAKSEPDTTLLNRYVEEICFIQKLMQKTSVHQYMSLKKICNPDQCRRLSGLYFELYGFKGQGRVMGAGKGMMHQYRRGQGKNHPPSSNPVTK